MQDLEGKPALLKVSSDWSISGGEMDKHFEAQGVQALLAGVVLLEIDVTEHTEDDQEFLSKYGVFGAPWILFFDENGERIVDRDIAGYLDANALAEHIRTTFGD